MTALRIISLIDRFVSGADTSIASANEIEAALDDAFPDDDYLQQTVEILAMYRPEGGEYLFDANAVDTRLRETRSYLLKLIV
ncbi:MULTISPECIES: hypothetical protein [unclassified Bradyrhizobium]|uniref:hypothetical protein n=1 Tax=unclassified Bradyrhizobium TaxID=2631580 RepID=UPI002FF140FE